ncbi:hypothetical protein JZO70_05890 [Enterococcus sp. 669A]|uniref:Uncharacterized protein n=1 Tax=Candidatus Enterococcus moelleringii TaxID=2815325 RepID=A0ABS3L7T3_9ENTE|nr:hypothetical protein [Enterococcus sp. 669A]MBO1305680.1 hypothetical protein [Enterococcus sp. 669A]
MMTKFTEGKVPFDIAFPKRKKASLDLAKIVETIPKTKISSQEDLEKWLEPNKKA